jgi:FixJ family two-component response regulator
VILDLIMPEMGGEQCLQGLLEINSHVAVIVSTGHLVPRKQREWLMEHAKGFVDKPYRAKQLLEALADALNK